MRSRVQPDGHRTNTLSVRDRRLVGPTPDVRAALFSGPTLAVRTRKTPKHPLPSGPIPQPPPPSVRARPAIPARVRSRFDPGSGLLDVDRQETGGACDCRTVCDGSVTGSTLLFWLPLAPIRRRGLRGTGLETQEGQVDANRRQKPHSQGTPRSGRSPSGEELGPFLLFGNGRGYSVPGRTVSCSWDRKLTVDKPAPVR